MDIGDHVDFNDEQRLEELLDSIQPGEKLILTMNRADAHEADELIYLLESRGFSVQPKGGHNDEYYLQCWRRDEE